MKFTDYDQYLFQRGENYETYRKMGAHFCELDGVKGVYFVLYAPNAQRVSIITNRNYWDTNADVMERFEGGYFEHFIPGMEKYDSYRYVITDPFGKTHYKSDPYGFHFGVRPDNVSKVYPLEDGYNWHDEEFMKRHKAEEVLKGPMTVYEVSPGSWKRDYRLNNNGFLNYRQIADELVEYLSYMSYSHVELMGICEYPYDGSWGYQVTGYFAPTSRFGTPEDFRYLVDKLHQNNIGVILDWVPAHFPKDDFALAAFDGTAMYESSDPLLAEYPEWGTKAFDHSKGFVRSFLISSAMYWIREFHIDGLRVDAVASMLYTNFGRSQWRPNMYGGTENLESINFLRQLNKYIRDNTRAFVIAEDSSIMQKITGEVEDGGLGFKLKWNMGWMNDSLEYFSKDPIYRKYHHDQLAHCADYVFTEHFINVLSHDEVVHLKHSMINKMPGDFYSRKENLKLLYTMQFTFPGKKLLFMGQDFGHEREWDENREIDWYLASDPQHREIMDCVKRLNALYQREVCFHSDSLNPVTFEWINRNDRDRNIFSYMRRNPWNYNESLIVVMNCSPNTYSDYCCGAVRGTYKMLFSTRNPEVEKEEVLLHSHKEECDGYKYRLSFELKGFEAIIFKLMRKTEDR